MKQILLSLALSALLGACASLSSPARIESGILVSPNGLTLYTFDRDKPGDGKSACVDKCAVNWPPLSADASAKGSGHWSVVTRPDGAKQWAYKGKPLYYWIKDQKPGDKTGDNVGNVWHIARD